MARRCTICAHKLDDTGICVNTKCPAAKKAAIDKAAKESTSEEHNK